MFTFNNFKRVIALLFVLLGAVNRIIWKTSVLLLSSFKCNTYQSISRLACVLIFMVTFVTEGLCVKTYNVTINSQEDWDDFLYDIHFINTDISEEQDYNIKINTAELVWTGVFNHNIYDDCDKKGLLKINVKGNLENHVKISIPKKLSISGYFTFENVDFIFSKEDDNSIFFVSSPWFHLSFNNCNFNNAYFGSATGVNNCNSAKYISFESCNIYAENLPIYVKKLEHCNVEISNNEEVSLSWEDCIISDNTFYNTQMFVSKTAHVSNNRFYGKSRIRNGRLYGKDNLFFDESHTQFEPSEGEFEGKFEGNSFILFSNGVPANALVECYLRNSKGLAIKNTKTRYHSTIQGNFRPGGAATQWRTNGGELV